MIRHLTVAASLLVGLVASSCGCTSDPGLWQFSGAHLAPWCRMAYLAQAPGYPDELDSAWYEVDLDTGAYSVVEDDYDMTINAIGYNRLDHRIYGVAHAEDELDTTTLVIAVIDPSVRPMHVETHYLPIRPEWQALISAGQFVGDVDARGQLYLSKTSATHFTVVDTDPLSPSYMTILDVRAFVGVSPHIGHMADWAFSPIDNRLYSMESYTRLRRVDPETGVVEYLGDPMLPPGRAFGACYFNSLGHGFWSDNGTGEIWRVDVSDPDSIDPTATLIAIGPLSRSNDGARCTLSP